MNGISNNEELRGMAIGTLSAMDKVAEELFGEFGFATCSNDEQVKIIEVLIARDFLDTRA